MKSLCPFCGTYMKKGQVIVKIPAKHDFEMEGRAHKGCVRQQKGYARYVSRDGTKTSNHHREFDIIWPGVRFTRYAKNSLKMGFGLPQLKDKTFLSKAVDAAINLAKPKASVDPATLKV